jgi:hypothetical protein
MVANIWGISDNEYFNRAQVHAVIGIPRITGYRCAFCTIGRNNEAQEQARKDKAQNQSFLFHCFLLTSLL